MMPICGYVGRNATAMVDRPMMYMQKSRTFLRPIVSPR